MQITKAIRARAADVRYVGEEPEWSPNKEYSAMDFIRAYNWYNYVLDAKDRYEILCDFITNPNVSDIEPSSIPNTVAALCRMQQRGLVLTNDQKQKFQDSVAKLMATATPKTKTEPKRQTNLNMMSDLIGDIEVIVDDFTRSFKSDFDMAKWLSEKNLSSANVTTIRNFYLPVLEELKAAASENDQDLVYGYSHLTKRQLKNYIAFIQGIVDACVIDKKPITRTRKTKPKTPQKLVSKLNYQREEASLNLKSIDPARIIGASELWLYNTKTRMMSHYVAETGGLSVKGSTLCNFSATSSSKKIRKPQTVLSLLDIGPKSMLKDYLAIRAVKNECNGRINATTLILRVVK